MREKKTNDEIMRLSKRLSELGLCSRREADRYIEKGWVKVDGQRVSELGYKVTRDQKVELTKEAKGRQASQVTVLLNKPVGYVSGQPEPDKNYPPAISLIKAANLSGKERFTREHLKGLAPAGRLDIDSKGLLVLTQDGRVAKLLVGQNSPVEKEYIVSVKGEITEERLKQLRFGLSLDGKKLKKAKVKKLKPYQLQMILNEGKKRQIRRMCELVGLEVTSLCRVRIGNIKLGSLEEGKFRYLRSNERF